MSQKSYENPCDGVFLDKIFKNICFVKHLRTADEVNKVLSYRCSIKDMAEPY